MTIFHAPSDDPDYEPWGDAGAWRAYDAWEAAEFDLAEQPASTGIFADLRPVVTISDAIAAVDGWPTRPERQNAGAQFFRGSNVLGSSPMPSTDIRPRCWSCSRPFIGWPGEPLCQHADVITFDEAIRPETRTKSNDPPDEGR